MKPLAERMRPETLDDYIGQEALLGQDGALTSCLLYTSPSPRDS